MNTRVTMSTIAADVGVTTATVSLALAGSPRISDATRTRVLEAAGRLQYRPSPLVSALMRIRRQRRPSADRPVIALVNGYARPDGWRKHVAPMIRDLRDGAIERAAQLGFRAEEFWLHRDGMTAARFSEMLRARGIQGLLLGPLAENAPLPKLKWDYFSGVGLCVPQPSVTLTTVCNDHYFSVLQSVRECHRLGYRRPALITRDHQRERFHGRWDAGYFMSRELLPDLTLVEPMVFDARTNLDVFSHWLAAEKPDVIISPVAETLLKMLRQLGWRVPRDIGLTATSCPSPDHPISGIYENGRLLGATAMDMLVDLLERHERGLPQQAITRMVEGRWNPGTTLRRIAGPGRSRPDAPIRPGRNR